MSDLDLREGTFSGSPSAEDIARPEQNSTAFIVLQPQNARRCPPLGAAAAKPDHAAILPLKAHPFHTAAAPSFEYQLDNRLFLTRILVLPEPSTGADLSQGRLADDTPRMRNSHPH